MQISTTIGLDVAKNVFQVHGIDAVLLRPPWPMSVGLVVQTFFAALRTPPGAVRKRRARGSRDGPECFGGTLNSLQWRRKDNMHNC